MLGEVGSRHGELDVGSDAELGVLHVAVVEDDGTIAHRPAVGQFAVEGHSGAASCLVTHDGDVGTLLHALHEVVGG